MEIDYNTARRMAFDFVNSSRIDNDERVILDEYTIAKEYGWYFFFNSKRFMDTGDDRYRLAGNAPFLVTKKGGKIIQFGTAYSIDYYIEQYENGSWPGSKPALNYWDI